MSTFIAVDFGAGSGRVIAGRNDGGGLVLDELHRFPNRQVRIGRHLYWDFPALFEEMKEGLRRAARKYDDIVSLGSTLGAWTTAWSTPPEPDGQSPLLPRRVDHGMPEAVFRRLDLSAHYAEAGIQVMPINTLFQLCVRRQENEAWLREARHLLFMPDLFAYYLTGIAGCEYSIASTSELLDARTKSWNRPLIRKLGLPDHLFGDLLMPGTVRGTLLPEVAAEVGLPPPR